IVPLPETKEEGRRISEKPKEEPAPAVPLRVSPRHSILRNNKSVETVLLTTKLLSEDNCAVDGEETTTMESTTKKAFSSSSRSVPYKGLNNTKTATSHRCSKALVLLALTAGSLALLATIVSMWSEITSCETCSTEVGLADLLEEDEVLFDSETNLEDDNVCSESSSFILTESIPLDVQYGENATVHKPLYEAWTELLSVASKSVHVASFYWSLTGEDIDVNTSSDVHGEHILQQFVDMHSRNVSVFVASSIPSLSSNSTDLKVLQNKGAHVRKVNFGHLTQGVLHTKLWIVDMKHIYIGSANMDWRSLTQVKELGAVIYNCSCLAKDLYKIFQSYWDLGYRNATVPQPWPEQYSTSFNKDNPLLLNINGAPARVYISGSPPIFCPSGRTKDLDAIVSAINEADKFINVAVMEYFPTTRFRRPHKYWPALDNALRRSAFERHVQIRILISCWQHSDPAMFPYLKSLSAVSYLPLNISVEIKLYIVPVGNHTDIPFARVNHNKYMVTDKLAYIGTSNWSEDYFNTTAGVGLVISQTQQSLNSTRQTVQEQLKGVFDRDWNSKYAINLDELEHHPHCAFSEKARPARGV
ncbi:5'-3' exonuclease PLD4-like, partial [Huso huso]